MSEQRDDGGPAFPEHRVEIPELGAHTLAGNEPRPAKLISHGGMSQRQYAAIHLRVPNSGVDWLDEMIREAKRDEMAGQAMESGDIGNMVPDSAQDAAAYLGISTSEYVKDVPLWYSKLVVKLCYQVADEFLAARRRGRE